MDEARNTGFGSTLFSKLDLLPPKPLSKNAWLALAAILVLGIVVRFAALDRIPPGLWYDEALYSMDGYRVSQGEFAWFFDRGGHPREPLFPWMLGLAFWLFEPTVLVARSVSALWGSLAMALFFPVARRFMPTRWALAATAVFAVFRWQVHFSRTIFRAGLASPLILLVIWLFLRWRERQRTIDAALCGAAVGLCLYTYISLRVVPILVTLWIGWLAWQKALSLRREWKQIAALYGTMLLVFVPLGIDYLQHPEHLFGRTDEITMFEKTVSQPGPDGQMHEVRVPKTTSEALQGIAMNAAQVAGAWFVRGDHVAKHNIPFRPVFDPVTGAFFLLGLIISLWALVRWRSIASLILLTWFGAFAMASVLSFGAPNILRMQGASPVVILLMLLGLYQLFQAWPAAKAAFVRRALPVLLLLFFAATQLHDYFFVFPKDLRVRQEFTADIFYEPAKAADDLADEVDKVYIPAELLDSLQVQFATIRHDNVAAYRPDKPLPAPGQGESAAWLITARSASLSEAEGLDQAAQVSAMEAARQLKTFSIPQADEEGRLVGRQPWAELWVKK